MYPSVEPYDSGHLDVGDRHAVYWEVVGSPDGLPAIWLHGGPAGAWLIMGIGLGAVALGIAGFIARQQRRSAVWS